MPRLRTIALVALAAVLAGAAPPKHSYAEGQVWEYQTRPEDAGSLLRIQKIEMVDAFAAEGPIYHISVIGLHFQRAPLIGEVGHLPVTQETLDASVTRLSSSKAVFPDPAGGIETWRNAKGGVFNIPMNKIVDFVERAAL